jgi:hypothetical protein
MEVSFYFTEQRFQYWNSQYAAFLRHNSSSPKSSSVASLWRPNLKAILEHNPSKVHLRLKEAPHP